MARCSKSRSLTCNRSASINRSPEPYMRHAANRCDPSRYGNSALTALTCRTTGTVAAAAPAPHPLHLRVAFKPGLVEEHERVQRLILRTSRNLPVDGEMREKRPDLRFVQLAGLALRVEQNEPPHPPYGCCNAAQWPPEPAPRRLKVSVLGPYRFSVSLARPTVPQVGSAVKRG
jgi:hypothetical protein